MNSEYTNTPKREIPPSPEEVTQAAEILSRLSPGFLPLEIFLETARLTPTAILEVVPVRKGADGTEVLLLTRPEDDPNWPGMLHTPGTVIRTTDVDGGLEKAIERIFDDELAIKTVEQTVQIGVDFHTVNRGVELATVYYSDLTNHETPNGTWYPADSLPENIVETQIDFIGRAVNAFNRNGEQQ